MLMVAAVWYAIITSVFSIVQYFIEAKLARNQKKQHRMIKYLFFGEKVPINLDLKIGIFIVSI